MDGRPIRVKKVYGFKNIWIRVDVASTNYWKCVSSVFHPDWQIDNGFFTGNHCAYSCGSPEKGSWRTRMALYLYFTEGLNQSLILPVAQTWLFLATQKLNLNSFCYTVMLWYFHLIVDVVIVRKPMVGFMFWMCMSSWPILKR